MRQNDTLTDKRYRVIAESIARRAKKQGMMPHEYQALTWVEIRGKAF
jgi:Zn-dependent peptidase ImmA (M78 family)